MARKIFSQIQIPKDQKETSHFLPPTMKPHRIILEIFFYASACVSPVYVEFYVICFLLCCRKEREREEATS